MQCNLPSPSYSKQREIFSVLIFFLSFILYLTTLFPAVHFGDTPELVGAAFNLGTAHPSGYPLYLLLAKLFTFLPIGTLAFKLNLLSALLGSISVTIIFIVVEMLADSLLIAFLSTLLFAISTSAWSQSIIGEVYTLNNLFIGLILLSSLQFLKSDQRRYLYCSVFLFGLGMANHITLLLIIPSILTLFIYEKKWIEFMKRLPALLIFFFIGFSTYLYLPVRGYFGKQATWFGSGNLSIKILVDYIFIAKDQNIITDRFEAKSIVFLVQHHLSIFLHYFELLSDEFSPFLLCFIPVGIVFLWKKKRKVFYFLTLLIIPFILLFVVFCDPAVVERHGVFVIPSFLVIALWIGCGLFWLIQSSSIIPAGRKITVTLSVIAVVFLLYKNYRQSDQSSNYIAHDYGRNILNTLEYKNNLNYYPGTQNIYLVFYENEYVENYRNDIVYGEGVIAKEGVKNYLYFKDPTYNEDQYDLVPAGLLYSLKKKGEEEKNNLYWDYYVLDDLEIDRYFKDKEGRAIRGEYYFFQAEYAASIGEIKNAKRLYTLSAQYNPIYLFERGKKYLRNDKIPIAKDHFLQVAAFHPDHDENNFNLGMIALHEGDHDTAIPYLERIKRIDAVSVDAYYHLGNIFYAGKNLKKTLYYWKRYLLFTPKGEKSNQIRIRLKIIGTNIIGPIE